MKENSNITIKDVAMRAGVAISTVSRVINGLDRVSDDTREKVFNAIAELGYIQNGMATAMVTGRTKIIMIIVPDFINDFFASVVQGAERFIKEQGYLAMVISTDDEEKIDFEKQIEQFLLMIDGAILIPSDNDDIDNYRHIKKPYVIVDRYLSGSGLDAVVIDNRSGAYQATQELIKHGHKRIGIIAGSTVLGVGRDRFDGYKQALVENLLPVDERYIRFGTMYEESGYKYTYELLRGDAPPTAIFVCNNLMCIGCIRAIDEMGLVIGDDISLVGFDDHLLASWTKPGITVVTRPTIEMGYKAAKRLFERIDNPGLSPEELVLSVTLTRRGSIRDIR